jgi:hypothetical protein
MIWVFVGACAGALGVWHIYRMGRERGRHEGYIAAIREATERVRAGK